MPFRSLFEHHSAKRELDSKVEIVATSSRQPKEQLPYYDASAADDHDEARHASKRASSSTNMDVKEP